jgi:di/tricarboxylate transporter
LLSVLGAFILSGTTSLGLFKALLIPIILISFLNMIKMEDLRNSIDVDLFLILVMALAIGKGISNSGAAGLLAGGMATLLKPLHSPLAALAGIYILTNVLAMLVTNKAAVAITFPISVALVEQLRQAEFPGLSYTPFMLAIAYAGCAEFITPFGYQTNLMVYGPGGYKFKDYVRFGTPLTILFMVVAVLLLGYLYDLY